MTDERDAMLEVKAATAGWRMDPEDFDQWKHPTFPGIYWDACDIPAKYLLEKRSTDS